MRAKHLYINLGLAVFSIGVFIFLKSLGQGNTQPNYVPVNTTSAPILNPSQTVTPDTRSVNACDFKSKNKYWYGQVTAASVDELSFDVPYIDVSYNDLTSFPVEKVNKTTVKQISLVKNNIPPVEQQRIKNALPTVMLAFYPQNYDNSGITNSWTEYSSDYLELSMKLPPQLSVSEKKFDPLFSNKFGENYIEIKNDFADFANNWSSCAQSESYINIQISMKQMNKGETLVDYLKQEWNATGKKTNGVYEVDENAMYSMIGRSRDIRIGKYNAVQIFAGEAMHDRYALQIGDKVYLFTVLTGGETGSRVGDFPTEIAKNIIATIKQN